MTPKKKSPAKRGRKPKPPGDVFDQLTVRLPAKLKFGLELLANHRGRNSSLSEAMQWAVLVGLNSWRVGHDQMLGDLLDRIWEEVDEPKRLMRAYQFEPALLKLEDRAAAQLISNCKEFMEMESAYLQATHDVMRDRKLSDLTEAEQQRLEKVRELHERRQEALIAFFSKHWSNIRKEAASLQDAGKLLVGQSMVKAAGIPMPRTMALIDIVTSDVEK